MIRLSGADSLAVTSEGSPANHSHAAINWNRTKLQVISQLTKTNENRLVCHKHRIGRTCFAGGYSSLSPEYLRNKNPDLIFCSLILLVTPLFALWSVDYSIRRWNRSRLDRTSLSRNPLNWWKDPLQSLFISTCVIGSMAMGGALRHPSIGSVGFWMVGAYTSLARGYLVRFSFTAYIVKTHRSLALGSLLVQARGN